MSNDQDFRDKLLLGINDRVVSIKEDISEIKVDIKEHIRRTNVLEGKVTWLERLFWTACGGVTVIFSWLKFFS